MAALPATTPDLALVFRLFVAAGIGALVGIEREQSATGGHFAGGRTHLLVALFGAITQSFFPALLPIALALVALLVAVGYGGKVVTKRDPGMATAIATVLTFLFGALAMHSHRGLVLAVVLGALTTVVLAGKDHVERFVDTIGEEERRASMKFLVVAFVVLPLLPNHKVSWLLGLNPQFVWLMVVFVSGLSFLAYALARLVGPHHGIGLSGLLGGFVSSTATAVSMANHATENHELSEVCGLATVLATLAMLPRALVEVAVINPTLVPAVLAPLVVMVLVGSVLTAALGWRIRDDGIGDTELSNPFRLRPALSFGLVFATILLVSERASALLGSTGIYATAFLAGLADVDSITITLSKLALEGDIAPAVATTGIVLAAIANTVVKVGIVWVLGTRKQGLAVTGILGVASLAGAVTILVL